MSSGPREGFPRQARLTRSADFERVLRHPDLRLSAGPLRLNAVFTRMHAGRLGLIVGKKAVAKAHARNRIKRIIRDRFRRERADLPAADLVIRVVAPVARDELQRRLDELFARLASESTKEARD